MPFAHLQPRERQGCWERLPNTGHTGANAAFQPFGGVWMPPGPWDGHKRLYNAKQGLSRFRSRMGAVTSKVLLPLVDTSARCL